MPEPGGSMDQETLREFEARCIQEESPPCTAACPLHLDARTFAFHMAGGRRQEALTVLLKTLPVPGILGRICDAPCMAACNRKDIGGAVRLGALERACLAAVGERRPERALPKKKFRVAVAGGGLSSLTTAWDLARKGYGVTLLTPEGDIGVDLLSRYPRRLSREAVDLEVRILKGLGVQSESFSPVSRDACASLLEEYDAVYVGLDGARDLSGILEMEAVTGKERFPGDTGREGLFVGGGHTSPVWQAAQGRWCATSIDRWLQKVSMTAGREREGPCGTRLVTRLSEVAPLSPISMRDTVAGYNETEAREEACRCLQCQCLECVKVCAYLERFGAYPKTYARQIYNNEAVVLGERKANRLINSCSLCGLCEAVCPNDVAMQDLCLAARQRMVARGKMPPSAHEFALRDMAFSQSDAFAMIRHGPECTESRHLFFPGCQLCASAPGQTAETYRYLRETLTGGVALMLGCCGAPARWAGRENLFTETLSRWEAGWKDLGRPRPVLACAACLQIFRKHLPGVGAVSLWEVLAAGLPEGSRVPFGSPLAIHDPCTTRDNAPVQNLVRRILKELDVAVEELDLAREHTECCGFGGLMENANPALAREVARRRGERSDRDFLAYCAMCRDSLAASGKRAVHLLDLLFPGAEGGDPAARPRPGWSERRENRRRLKIDLCRTVWGDRDKGAGEKKEMRLEMAPAVAALLESRRILEEDVRGVIFHAENGGHRFYHPGRRVYLAMLRSGHVTFWVTYCAVENGYRVHGAYAHRMEVLEP